MAGVGPTDLYGLAEDFLDVLVEALDTIPGYDLDLLGAPERRFVSPAAPIADCCEQLAVLVNPLGVRDQQPKATAMINMPNLIAVATRCVPIGYGEGDNYIPPTVAELNAASRQIYADGWAIWNHLHARIREGTFLERCDVKEFRTMQQLAQEGECAGWSLTVAVSLDGYELAST